MENRSHAFMTGIFTLSLLVAAVLFGIWFNRDRVEYDPYLLATTLAVPGLNPQAAVRYRGLEVGKVDAIDFDPKMAGQILIHLAIDPATPITKTTYATLGYQGVTGIAYIQLDDASVGSQRLATNANDPARIPLRPGLLDQLEKRGTAILSQAVMQGLVERAVRLLDADQGGASQLEGDDTTFVVADKNWTEYDSLQVAVNRRYSNGLTVYGNYNFSKTLQNMESALRNDNSVRLGTGEIVAAGRAVPFGNRRAREIVLRPGTPKERRHVVRPAGSRHAAPGQRQAADVAGTPGAARRCRAPARRSRRTSCSPSRRRLRRRPCGRRNAAARKQHLISGCLRAAAFRWPGRQSARATGTRPATRRSRRATRGCRSSPMRRSSRFAMPAAIRRCSARRRSPTAWPWAPRA